MKRRIAVFANGWGTEYLREVVKGIHEIAKDVKADIFAFVDFSSHAEQEKINRSESNIFRLPELRDFDGAVVMANSFNMQEEIDLVYDKVRKAGIPVVSIEHEFEGITTISTDNYNGMYELTQHVIQKHGARHIVFVSGPKEHAENNIRLQAVRDAACANGLFLKEEDIICGDWAKLKAQEQLREWMNQYRNLPDVFICANDIMATGICETVMEWGYRVLRMCWLQDMTILSRGGRMTLQLRL